MLKLDRISFYRGEKQILSDISFQLKKGETIGIVGPSGIGKSTLLKIAAGKLDPQHGEILFHKKKIKRAVDSLIPGVEDIQLLNQDFELDLYHTVEENLRLQAMHLSKKECAEMVEEMVELLELSAIRKLAAHNISGGEQQRLALGRALCKEPQILLLDEPFAHLDIHIKIKLTHYLKELQRIRKTSFILVSHNGAEIMSLSNRILYINEGKIKREASPESFYFSPETHEEGLFFGELNNIKLNRKEHLFRPTEFSLEATEKHTIPLAVVFKKDYFAGAFYENHFKHQRQTLVLYSTEKLTHVETIFIK
jgi:ABC-type Fe3+/spermidine/putrescine transport system ATPase subunit